MHDDVIDSGAQRTRCNLIFIFFNAVVVRKDNYGTSVQTPRDKTSIILCDIAQIDCKNSFRNGSIDASIQYSIDDVIKQCLSTFSTTVLYHKTFYNDRYSKVTLVCLFVFFKYNNPLK